MKFNKKLLIPVFATAMGLSVIGGISGAVAWYQYNSKVVSSFVGTSVADTGVLQIRDRENGSWTRAVESDKIEKLRPMTFGETLTDGIALNADGWYNPEAGAGNGYYEGSEVQTGWLKAERDKQFVQFDLEFNAVQTDKDSQSGYRAVAREVYLNKYYLRCIDEDGNEISGKLAADAMRIQFDVDETEHFILAKKAETIDLFGELDLDHSTTSDKYHKTPFNVLPPGAVNGETIIYGKDTETQTTVAIDDYTVVDEDHDVQGSGSGATPLFSTKGSDTEFTHVRITIWLEGWAMLDSTTQRAEWNASKFAEYDVQVALQFTSGIFRGDDLTPVNSNNGGGQQQNP